MRRRNAQNYTTHAEVADWYSNKFTEMGGAWHVPDEEIDMLLDMLLTGGRGAEVTPVRGRGSDHLIELGCGDGKLILRAVLRGLYTTGVDISPVAIQMTAVRMTEAGFPPTHSVSEDWGVQAVSSEHWAVYRIPMEKVCTPFGPAETMRVLSPGACTHAISYGSMEHALSIPDAVREMARVLKSTGRFLLYVPNEEWIHEDQPLETTASAQEWISLLQGAGLQVTLVRKVGDNNIIVGVKP